MCSLLHSTLIRLECLPSGHMSLCTARHPPSEDEQLFMLYYDLLWHKTKQ